MRWTTSAKRFATLKRWLQTRPQYVGATIIAEGLEQEPDLPVLWSVGVRLCQGYLVSRPAPAPRVALRPEFEAQLLALRRPAGRDAGPSRHLEDGEAGRLARQGHTVTPDVSCARVLDIFSRDEHLHALPVLDPDWRPVGMLAH